jgi:hypothetical protein
MNTGYMNLLANRLTGMHFVLKKIALLLRNPGFETPRYKKFNKHIVYG